MTSQTLRVIVHIVTVKKKSVGKQILNSDVEPLPAYSLESDISHRQFMLAQPTFYNYAL